MWRNAPHHLLEGIKAVIAARGIDCFTRSAQDGIVSMGLTAAQAIAVLLALERVHFFKSMTTYAGPRVWYEVHHAQGWQRGDLVQGASTMTHYCLQCDDGTKLVRTMSNRRYASARDAIEDTPAEVETMKLRSELMMALEKHITRTGMSQAQTAKLFGVTQPRVSDLMRGKINLFGLNALVNMAAAASLHVEMCVLDAA